MNVFRQGDVLIIEVDGDVAGEPIARENGRIVLAHGEVTGHAHTIANPAVAFVTDSAHERYLVSDEPFVVRHQEHAPVRVPAGTFKIVRQVEYTPTEIRNVAD